jgi:protein-disulfide isomerase
MKIQRVLAVSTALIGMLAGPLLAHAQFAGTGARDHFRDTTILRPPTGSKVALIVFEDLGCPSCAKAHPFEVEAVRQTHVTLLRYDFPIEDHVWTFEGAVCVRYVEHTYGAQVAEDFRSAVFQAQREIYTKDDIRDFLSTWLAKRGKKMPAALDPTGNLAKEVTADRHLGMRLNVEWTPTVVVVTRDNYQVVCGTKDGANDPAQILAVVKAAIAQTH